MAKRKKNTRSVPVKGKRLVMRHRSTVNDLLIRVEKLAVGQPIKKLSAILGIPEVEILEVVNKSLYGCSLETKLTSEQLVDIKPHLAVVLERLLETMPPKKMVERSMGKGNAKEKGTLYNKMSSHKGFVKIIYTKM